MFWHVVLVISRLLGEAEAPAPVLAERSVLFIKRQDVVIGCGTGDAGVGMDAGADLDAGTDAMPDAVPDAMGDAGASDAGVSDAGATDAGCSGTPVDAITMIVQPEVVQLVSDARFAVLYVTPSRPAIELTAPVFAQLALMTAPRVEIEEVEVEDETLGTECSNGCGGASSQSEGGGCGAGYSRDHWDPPGLTDAGFGEDLSVDMIGPYEVVRAQPGDVQQLMEWLDGFGYTYEQADLDAVAPYIELGYTVVAVRVAIDTQVEWKLRPLAMTWAGTEVRVPAALARTPQPTATTLSVYVAAEGRYEFPNATIDYAQRTSFGATGFLTRNDLVLDQSQVATADPIAERVLGDPERRAVRVEVHEIRVPKTVYCDDGDYGCCSDCSTRKRTRIDLGLVVIAVGLALRRRRRRRT